MNPIQPTLDQVISERRELIINIVDDEDRNIGTLQPLTVEHLQCDDIIEKLTNWRNLNMANFLTQFVATPERTNNWLKNVVFKNKGQMLFLIYVGKKVIGHYGFKDLTTDEVLLDNAMRGERYGDPKLLVYAGKALVQWLFVQANVKRIKAEVMIDNIPAIMMNKKIGFQGWKKVPMLKKNINNELRFVFAEERRTSAINMHCYKIYIDKLNGN